MINNYNTAYSLLHITEQPQEVQAQFWDCIASIPYIRELISADRKFARDIERDGEGKIIVDITKPHILEDMDYFRPSALHFKETGKFTDLMPNANPNSEYGKWIREEIRRCWDGYVRPSDGEWITGDYYFFLNYCPIQVIKTGKHGESIRTIDFPSVWDGHYYKFHYLDQCRACGKHAVELSRRGCGKSYCGAALLAKRFILGESKEVNKKVQCVVTASDKKYISGANQILDMFQSYTDFCANNTQFPARRIVSSVQKLQWTMGYVDSISGTKRGTENSVLGITSKDNESKLRGSRGVLYILEEAGTFPRLRSLYQILRPSVEDGSKVWGLIYLYGTSGDTESDFSSLQELMYNPIGYNIYSVKNVYDKEGQGRSRFTYFFPGYMNRAGCYDENGNSDITKALMQLLIDRYVVKYNSSDLNAITKRIAELPITPQEAILKSQDNMFPITELNARLSEIDNDPSFYDTTYVGNLIQGKDGNVTFQVSADKPIRDFPLQDNKTVGAIEFYALPEKDPNGKVFRDRYIIGLDPVDDDSAETMSLYSNIVLDLWTDTIVAEYTGRHQYADENFETTRKLCLFYNCRVLYESNKKGIYAYFLRLNCTHLLEMTPEYLKDKSLIKDLGYGNKAYGVNATAPINNYANTLIKDWLLKPVTKIEKDSDGNTSEVTLFNLTKLNNRALIKELILFNPVINVDRVRALGMTMLFREEYMVKYGGQLNKSKTIDDSKYLGNDKYFTLNYDARFKV